MTITHRGAAAHLEEEEEEEAEASILLVDWSSERERERHKNAAGNPDELVLREFWAHPTGR